MKVLFSFCSGEPKGLFATLHRISIQQTGCLPKGLFDKIVLRLQIKKNVKSTCNITAFASPQEPCFTLNMKWKRWIHKAVSSGLTNNENNCVLW